ncbi:hypothetical protein [Providencia manganoxydans]|uniref:hypothetical protein n=1 Tax=Providencia manganoxydans TaxID=2923283 RepID=UPI0029BFD202|nr:hypothetical protein [Providencia manganoxydans]MDX4946468.1 hypothetical protein [Providencia manganoxydans]
MKRILAVAAVVALLAGCGESDPKYDGEYICDVDQISNSGVISNGNPNAFPKELEKANIVVSNRVITVKGLENGDYITPKLNEKKDSNGDDYLFLDSDNLNVAFTKKVGIFGVVFPDKSGQFLMNCKIK